ncbi:RNA exonuclease 4 [Octopus bimaculoides]|uniref:RNA exonuclease 4 n=1 Tax=Octopus bimaculoides TaxID=37653 RepID=A0A0L8GEN3_OCTBM|nr:RNA exonuclease 4 [Octopus bimaculoides]XP_052834002.1 RNA exonuclease 4 [Octopus bimaculoides]XP_052834003.1 RNA exonuclease 4 [Octopus bimaculoides]|eukprot:XP_014781665.1 PREDICTED: RNA exonuclease 4-like [Octopus bimaculoides]
MAQLNTPCVALDCEMVGTGPLADIDMLARASLVNQDGECIYDRYVKPSQKITSYRTSVSGITPDLLIDATDFRTVQRDVAALIKDSILVGHSVNHDLDVLELKHPEAMTRDTAYYQPFMLQNKNRSPSLKILAQKELGLRIQQNDHNSVTDAQATMGIYRKHRKNWERKWNK